MKEKSHRRLEAAEKTLMQKRGGRVAVWVFDPLSPTPEPEGWANADCQIFHEVVGPLQRGTP